MPLTQLLVQASVVGRDKAAGAFGGSNQLVVQFGLIHALDLRPMQASVGSEFDVFGGDTFGDAQCGGDVFVRVVEFEFETQNVFGLTHNDPSDGGYGRSSKNWRG
jgi:hypothetical protein